MNNWYVSGGRWYNDEEGINLSMSEAYVRQVNDRELRAACKRFMLRYSTKKLYNDAKIINELATEFMNYKPNPCNVCKPKRIPVMPVWANPMSQAEKEESLKRLCCKLNGKKEYAK